MDGVVNKKTSYEIREHLLRCYIHDRNFDFNTILTGYNIESSTTSIELIKDFPDTKDLFLSEEFRAEEIVYTDDKSYEIDLALPTHVNELIITDNQGNMKVTLSKNVLSNTNLHFIKFLNCRVEKYKVLDRYDLNVHFDNCTILNELNVYNNVQNPITVKRSPTYIVLENCIIDCNILNIHNHSQISMSNVVIHKHVGYSTNYRIDNILECSIKGLRIIDGYNSFILNNIDKLICSGIHVGSYNSKVKDTLSATEEYVVVHVSNCLEVILSMVDVVGIRFDECGTVSMSLVKFDYRSDLGKRILKNPIEVYSCKEFTILDIQNIDVDIKTLIKTRATDRINIMTSIIRDAVKQLVNADACGIILLSELSVIGVTQIARIQRSKSVLLSNLQIAECKSVLDLVDVLECRVYATTSIGPSEILGKNTMNIYFKDSTLDNLVLSVNTFQILSFTNTKANNMNMNSSTGEEVFLTSTSLILAGDNSIKEVGLVRITENSELHDGTLTLYKVDRTEVNNCRLFSRLIFTECGWDSKTRPSFITRSLLDSICSFEECMNFEIYDNSITSFTINIKSCFFKVFDNEYDKDTTVLMPLNTGLPNINMICVETYKTDKHLKIRTNNMYTHALSLYNYLLYKELGYADDMRIHSEDILSALNQNLVIYIKNDGDIYKVLVSKIKRFVNTSLTKFKGVANGLQ